MHKVSVKTVDSRPKTLNSRKLHLLGWGSTCFELRVLGRIASRNSIIGPTCAEPFLERLSFKKYQKTVFQKTAPRRLEWVWCWHVLVWHARPKCFKLTQILWALGSLATMLHFTFSLLWWGQGWTAAAWTKRVFALEHIPQSYRYLFIHIVMILIGL